MPVSTPSQTHLPPPRLLPAYCHSSLLPMEAANDSTESGTPIPLGLRIFCTLMMYVHGFVRRKDGTLNRRLADLLVRKAKVDEKPFKGVSTRDLIIDEETGVWVRIFLPDTEYSSKMPILFHFHGGGFAVLSADAFVYDVFCRRLSRRCEAIVISVDYRRAPEHRFPTAYDDGFLAVRWLQAKGKDYLPSTADLSQCFLIGDSAGANIVHHVGCRATMEDLSPVKIVGHLLLSPFFGGEERTPAEQRLVNAPIVSVEGCDWYWKAYLPKGANRDHPACNVFGPNAPDISALSLPPSVVVIGEYDPLKDWQVNYADWLKQIGKEVEVLYYKGGIHSFHLFFGYELSSLLLRDLRDRIIKLVNK